MSLFSLYLLTILPGIGALLGILGGVALFMTVSTAFIYGANSLHDYNEWKTLPHSGKLISAALLMLVASSFIPSRDDLYFMAGGYIATNTEGIDKLSANALKALNAFLEEVSTKKESENHKKEAAK